MTILIYKIFDSLSIDDRRIQRVNLIHEMQIPRSQCSSFSGSYTLSKREKRVAKTTHSVPLFPNRTTLPCRCTIISVTTIAFVCPSHLITRNSVPFGWAAILPAPFRFRQGGSFLAVLFTPASVAASFTLVRGRETRLWKTYRAEDGRENS